MIENTILDNNLNEQISYKTFFTALGYTDNDKIYLRTFKDKGDKDGGMNSDVALYRFDSILSYLHSRNADDRGIFFCVNGDGQSDRDVKHARAQFIDFDDFPFEEQIRRLNDFPLEPSIVVKTRKSLHCYWILEDGEIKFFREVQERLNQYFGSDKVIKNESRVMRLYGFEHRKSDPVMVTLIKFDPDLKYTQRQFHQNLPLLQKTMPEKTSSVQVGEKVPIGQGHAFGVKKLGEAVRCLGDRFSDEAILRMVLEEMKERYEGTIDENEFFRQHRKTITQFRSRDGRIEEGYKQLKAQREEKEKNAVINVGDYLRTGRFSSDIEYFKKYKDRKTGFENLDKYVTLYPGVCCLGGASSLGKTTFAVNLCDNLLERGESVIYFSLEQLSIEIVTKSLARRLYEADPMTILTNLDIKDGASSPELEEVKKEYAKTADNLVIVEADFMWTAKSIRDYVETYMKEKGITPVVVIDYLQLIAPPEDFRGTQREIIDYNLKALKAMSREKELFVLLISSFNRASYIEPVSYESFKESGMIEFTCDYIFGLQLSILEDSSFYSKPNKRSGEKENNLDKKRKAIYDAQKNIEKEVELVSMKNRNGKQVFKCFFKYRMDYDTFMPDLESPHDPDIKRLKSSLGLSDGFEEVVDPTEGFSKRAKESIKLSEAFSAVIKRSSPGHQVTLRDMAEELDVSTNVVKRRIKEYGKFAIDGETINPAGIDTVVEKPEFIAVSKSIVKEAFEDV